MPKASPIRASFNAGELSPMLDGRVDIAKYGSGCKVLENFIPAMQGPAVRRAGTRFVKEIKNSSNRTWLAKFEFSNTQAYILEFGDYYVRFYTDHGQLTLAATPTAWSSATSYSIGDLVSYSGTNYYAVSDGINHTPPNTNYWYPLTGTIYELPTPYSVSQLVDADDNTFKLSIAQSGDVLYIAHPLWPTKKLSRYDADANGNPHWILSNVAFKNGPFQDANTDKNITLLASSTSGTITLTANVPFFSNEMVGQYIYLEPADLSNIRPWTAGQEFPHPVNPALSVPPIYRRANGRTYQCVTNASASTANKAIRTGADMPMHTYGTACDGGGDYGLVGTDIELEGLEWKFIDTGFGYVQITGYTDSKNVTAIVQGDYPLPMGVSYGGTYVEKTIAAMSNPQSSTVTISNASPAVVTWNSHGLSNGNKVSFSTTGSLPSPLTINTTYYVVSAGANTFQLSLTLGGASINTTTAGSGTHTCYLAKGETKLNIVSHSLGAVGTTGNCTINLQYYALIATISSRNNYTIYNRELQTVGNRFTYTVLDSNNISINRAWDTRYDSYVLGGTLAATITVATWRWALGAFGGLEDYPSKVTFFRERLTLAKDQHIYFSVAGDFENFGAKNDSGEIAPDMAINVELSSDHVDTIQWLSPSQALLIGTQGAEFVCAENSTSEPFSPGNVKIEQQTNDGSKSVTPVLVGYSTLMVQRSGRKIKELNYNFQQNGYVSNDLTALADHITINGITQTTWHREPYIAMWACRGDGQLLGFTFNKEQDVVGWHRHIIGGSFGTGDAVVESVCVIPAPDRSRDELWMIVKRTINGTTKRYIEYMDREYRDGDDQADAYYVDCGGTYSGAATTTITGLSHLEGQTVQVLADGATHPDRTVTGGQISLQIAASTVHVGLGYDSVLQTNRIEAGSADGTAQGKTKRINKCIIRFYNTLGAKAGPDSDNLDELQFRSASDPMNAPPPIFTGDKLMDWPGGYDFDGYVMVVQSQPLPMTVVAIMPHVTTFDRT